MEIDYLIIGAGLTGSTIARLLYEKKYKVLILERRNHIGGNIYDYNHASGIKVHKYGPHYFRTNSDKIWSFVNRFSNFYKYEAEVKTIIDDNIENWPITKDYIINNIGIDWKPAFNGIPQNFEEAALSLMPKSIYNKFIRDYNIKQWGKQPKELETNLIKRFDIRENHELKLILNKKYQGLPTDGYSNMISNMIKDIPIILGFDFIKNRNTFNPKKMTIYTGPIDEFFNFDLGKLEYRGQKRVHKYLPYTNWYQSHVQINNPSLKNGTYIRRIEWKHLLPYYSRTHIKGTVITDEIPFTPSNPQNYEYPFPSNKNKLLYKQYEKRAFKTSKLLICGRLGEYKYYDMDQAIGRAMSLIEKKILKNEK